MKFAVMGSPISHSHSPTLHKAAFRFLGVDAEYEAIEKAHLTRDDFSDYAGLSLTMPLKLDAFAIADSHDDESLATGVSNTLLISNNRAIGLNTDVYGIMKSVESLAIETVQIIGTGATAKSAAIALKDKELFFTGRNPEKQTAIEQWAASLGISVSVSQEVDLVIDTTPGESEIAYAKHTRVLDVAYAADRNKNNPKLISGLEMLLHQAVVQNISFSTMAGAEKIDFDELTSVMRRALVERVGEWSNA